ncbi:tRNA (guanosine(37)-N1)-methyltransferase TrmD [Patescibacteria group bacterium]|nr:tRNA (guanosine(37)-N1)-methyltransferase TrmD [Patescibacteria group bacterium]MBU1931444.1 tRNA (guanosine(37)-N1)-methyltransferase TrmD [Patescibacteria group bacterium]
MKIDVLTIFPEMFAGPLDASLIGKAQKKGLVQIKIHDLRRWAENKYQSVDDRPFGGGPGMVMRPDVIDRAIKSLNLNRKSKVILLTPQGTVFNQKKAQKLSKEKHLIFICGHYEGVDERIREHLIDEEISIGDYVLTGGELPAMVVIDTVVRLIPNVVGKPESLEQESFTTNRLDHPQYTRPADYKGWQVPKVLLSGDHQQIAEWRKKQALKKTKARRPDLLLNNR